jgi:hypothetical protein
VSLSSYNPIMGSTLMTHLILITSQRPHLQISSTYEIGIKFQYINVWGDIQTIVGNYAYIFFFVFFGAGD